MTEEPSFPIFWTSATHRGSIRRLHGTTADGTVHDLGIWANTVEIRLGRENAVPYESVEAALDCLTEKYEGFRLVSEVDALAALTT